MKKHGFSLLEVMIALGVLAIVLLGIYSVMERAVSTATYVSDRHYTINKGYERVLRHLHYPRISLAESEVDNETTTTFSYIREETPIPGIIQVKMQISTPHAKASYEYFERGM